MIHSEIMPPENPKMSFVFFVPFENTFKIDIFGPDLVKIKCLNRLGDVR